MVDMTLQPVPADGPPPPPPTPLALQPIERGRQEPKTSDRVLDVLISAIRDMTLPPGTLLSETDLARKLEVSRTPIREAIVRLVDAGPVHVMPQVGTLVTRIRISDVEEARFVRESLEVAAFDLVCEMPLRDVKRLRELIVQQEAAQAAHDLDRFFACDEAMHVEIFALAGYPSAWQAVQRKKLQLDRVRRLSLPDSNTLQELIEEHRSIVDCLELGDAEAGRAYVRAHARRALVQIPDLRRTHPDYFAD